MGLKGTLGVTAYDRRGILRPDAFHTEAVDIAAPGTEIRGLDLNGGYRYLNGTSGATAHVTGLVALLRAKFASMFLTLSQEDAENLLAIGAGGVKNNLYGWGRANLSATLNLLEIPYVFKQATSAGPFAVVETVDIPNFEVNGPFDVNVPPTGSKKYWARRTKWRTPVTFDFSSAPKPIRAVSAWGRGALCVGYDDSNPNTAYGSCVPTNITTTGCDIVTYQYELRECVGPNCDPGAVVGTYPTGALHVAYSYLGFPDVATSVGPEDLVDAAFSGLDLRMRSVASAERAIVELALGFDSDVHVRVYDVSGRLVRDLHRGRMPRGLHEISWALTTNAGAKVAAGVYFVRADGNWLSASTKFVVVK